MKIMVLGANGMIGHRLAIDMASFGHEVIGVVRNMTPTNLKLENIKNISMLELKDIKDINNLKSFLKKNSPDIILNAIGVVKQNKLSNDAEYTYEINSIFPNTLALLCEALKIRLFIFSTDCVFSGVDGAYSEDSIPDALDIYGKSKFLGEVKHLANTLTIRTSTIGRELGSKKGLLEWFLNSNNTVSGYKNVIYSGLTIKEISSILNNYIFNKNISGLLHIAGPKIDKYELLNLFSKHFKKNIKIEIDNTININRHIDDSKFLNLTGYHHKTWDEMLNELSQDQLTQNIY